MYVCVLYVYTCICVVVVCVHVYVFYVYTCICVIVVCSFVCVMYVYMYIHFMGWLRLVDSLKLLVSFAKEPFKRDNILQKRPIISRSHHVNVFYVLSKLKFNHM